MNYEYLEKEDVFLITGELPPHIDGFCKEVGPYRFAIVSDHLDGIHKRATALHEIHHITRGDIHSDKTARELEDTV